MMATNTPRRGLVLALLAVLLACASACRTPAFFRHEAADVAVGNDACSTCKWTVSLLSDLLCDPYVDDTMATWLVSNVCSQVADKDQCVDIIRGVTPALVQWLRANANPDTMCGTMGVCGSATSAADAPSPLQALFSQIARQQQPERAQQAQPRMHAARANDMTCPLCMFVAVKVKEQINDPATQRSIHDASLAACAQLPAGLMQDACTSFVEQYEMMYVRYLADMEPQEVCMIIGTCMDSALARLQGKRNAPLLQLSPALLAPLSHIKGLVDAAQASPRSNDHCETCKVVVQELHQIVANPDLQQQAIDYAKQACTVFPSYEATCKADVDQYAPMAFGMALAYLQPQQVCVQIKMCPPPSSSRLFTIVSLAPGSLLPARFAALEDMLSSRMDAFVAAAVADAQQLRSAVLSSSSAGSSDAMEAAAAEEEEEAGAAEELQEVPQPRFVVRKRGKVHGPGLVLPQAA